MAITLADFNKIWSSTSPLSPYTFSDDNYNEGWNFIGQIPPSRQMWDFLQKNNDEKMQYLANNYLPLSGGTLTGDVNGVTPTAGDNSTKLTTTAFTHNEIQTNALAITPAYMPEIPNGADLNTYLTAGSYRCTGSGVAASLVNTPYTGSNFTLLVIHGGNAAKYVRQILFTTSDAVATTNLIYTRSCDGSGNNWTSWKQIAYAEDVLALSGGIMTGDILFSTNNESTVKKTVDNSAIRILGGSAWDCGGSIIVYGKSNSGQNPGGFELNAHDGTNVKGLLGKPNGTLTWDGNRIDFKTVTLTQEVTFDFNNGNIVSVDTDGNELKFDIPTGGTKIISVTLLSGTTNSLSLLWYSADTAVKYEQMYIGGTKTPTITVKCLMIYI